METPPNDLVTGPPCTFFPGLVRASRTADPPSASFYLSATLGRRTFAVLVEFGIFPLRPIRWQFGLFAFSLGIIRFSVK